MNKATKIKIYNHLINNNDYNYNLLKASEELQELSLALIQKLNKDNITTDANIIDEIGDVKIRLKVLTKLFSKSDQKKRINYKLTKFNKYIVDKTYKNI